jgi:phospholipid/cholesterol/gamma-HCH transport system substrate-binding protein
MTVSKEVKAGLLVITAILLFVFGFNFLKGRNIFHPQRHFYAVYDQVEGLSASNPVLVNGFGVGLVSSITLVPGKDGYILVEFTVNNDDLLIPNDSKARIESQDLMGSKAIVLQLGNSDVFISNGDTLQSEVQVSLTEEVQRQVAPLKAKAEHLISTVDSVMIIVQSLLSKEVISDLEKSIKGISRTVGSLERTASKLDTVMGEEKGRIQSIIRNVESISSNFKDNNERLNLIIQNFHNISDSLASANFASTINNAEKALAETNLIMEKINKGEGSLGMLVNDQKLYNNLERASGDLDKLLEDIRLNPKRYLHFSIIGRRERSQ